MPDARKSLQSESSYAFIGVLLETGPKVLEGRGNEVQSVSYGEEEPAAVELPRDPTYGKNI